MTMNHTTMTGPKRRPTRAVPNRWAANSATMITAVMGMTSGSSSGRTTSSPSTDERTEIAGVIMLSPKKREAPKTPRAASSSLVCVLPGVRLRLINVINERMPPSPLLSARITSSTYLTVTMIVTDQKISEINPYTLAAVGGTGCGSAGLNRVWIV